MVLFTFPFKLFSLSIEKELKLQFLKSYRSNQVGIAQHQRERERERERDSDAVSRYCVQDVA